MKKPPTMTVTLVPWEKYLSGTVRNAGRIKLMTVALVPWEKYLFHIRGDRPFICCFFYLLIFTAHQFTAHQLTAHQQQFYR
ncbi:hypothetical protein [[Limnothrix rosea] IAM M-220]|uniref:hypothetical protein n=1 Tax=[Limnothrix rosea] IAM M-220 TaxID=454133 RepID=UPI001115668F|nr:hypothetical protein [[Limnothrix rosea] IAM M-220]